MSDRKGLYRSNSALMKIGGSLPQQLLGATFSLFMS